MRRLSTSRYAVWDYLGEGYAAIPSRKTFFAEKFSNVGKFFGGLLILGVGWGGLRVGVAVDPAGVAALVVLFFPDGDAGFDFVDNVLAGFETRTAVGGGDADPYCDAAQIE